MDSMGVARLLYTDIARDGTLSGPDIEINKRLTGETGLAVLASGGVASLNDVPRLVDTGVEGVVVGRALYTGAGYLAEAIDAALGE